MDRLIVTLSVILFITTWCFLIVLTIDEFKPQHYAKDHTISTEITLSEKTAERFMPLVDARTEEKIKREQTIENTQTEIGDPLQHIPLKDFSNEDGISIDALLELLNIEYDAAPLS
ncbi:hypothetical protein ACLIA0_08590 [Bacillaceae bacterium W0354]